MEAKDTVMSDKDLDKIELEISEGRIQGRNAVLNALVEAQAKISFKAGMKHGIWLFAWWKDGVQYVGTSGRTLEEAYKELGIIETKKEGD